MTLPATLRNICVKKTSELLANGVWDTCRDNPFSSMPSSVVDQLLSAMWPSKSALDKVKIRHIRPLLTSDRLEHVDLTHTRDEGEYVTLLWMLSCGCQNLRSLTLLWGQGTTDDRDNINEERVLQELLQKSAQLEHFHSCVYFKPNALRNCRNLKTVRIHLGVKSEMFMRGVTSGLLKGLESIELLACCFHPTLPPYEDDFRAELTILDSCPRLTSLGVLDSSRAVKELHDRDLRTLGTSRRFEMRRCLWDNRNEVSKSDYCDTIRVAALSCPLVVVLSIVVSHAAALKHLKSLKFLTCLDIGLYFEGDFEPEFHSLLNGIGSRLQHMTISTLGSKPLNLSKLADKCPNLRTLQLRCKTTACAGVSWCAPWLSRPSVKFMNLQQLNVLEKIDRRGLEFLLSNCLHLKVLFMWKCLELEDDTLRKILRKNPFVELEIAVLHYSYLSRSVCKCFVKSAAKLAKCYIQSYKFSEQEFKRFVKDVNPSVGCRHRDFIGVTTNSDFFEPLIDLAGCNMFSPLSRLYTVYS